MSDLDNKAIPELNKIRNDLMAAGKRIAFQQGFIKALSLVRAQDPSTSRVVVSVMAQADEQAELAIL